MPPSHRVCPAFLDTNFIDSVGRQSSFKTFVRYLEEKMGAVLGPSHLVSFEKSLTQNLVGVIAESVLKRTLRSRARSRAWISG
jgi:hypothetical protein